MLKTSHFQVASKEAFRAFASKYQLEIYTREEKNKTTYSLLSNKIFEGNVEELCKEFQKLLSNEELVFFDINCIQENLFIAITPDKIITKPATSITSSILLDMLNL